MADLSELKTSYNIDFSKKSNQVFFNGLVI